MDIFKLASNFEKLATEQHKPEHLEYRGHTIKVFYEDGDWIAEIAKIGDKEGRMPQFGLQKEVAIKRAKEAIDKMCNPREKLAHLTKIKSRETIYQTIVSHLADALGGNGWDNPRLAQTLEGWVKFPMPWEDQVIDIPAEVDALLNEGFDPRHLIQD